MSLSHGFSSEAIAHAKAALERGNGTMAQFSHPELGGSGQWMPGMVMIGDAFNQALKARVLALFTELASLPQTAPASQNTSTASTSWWPEALGKPSQSGGQNALAYAYFPASHCLAVRRGSTVTLHDTRDHSVTGISAQNDQLTVQTATGHSFLAEMLPRKA
ncbi:hypothetical protein [Armatimonas sp.]|uniref:hypothetical protein n=1 Tax=Armatimonas sp. TaxID=1872638 RepID=UPI00286B5557|nr:hypothetical protein [Armatimonas sp.]